MHKSSLKQPPLHPHLLVQYPSKRTLPRCSLRRSRSSLLPPSPSPCRALLFRRARSPVVTIATPSPLSRRPSTGVCKTWTRVTSQTTTLTSTIGEIHAISLSRRDTDCNLSTVSRRNTSRSGAAATGPGTRYVDLAEPYHIMLIRPSDNAMCRAVPDHAERRDLRIHIKQLRLAGHRPRCLHRQRHLLRVRGPSHTSYYSS